MINYIYVSPSVNCLKTRHDICDRRSSRNVFEAKNKKNTILNSIEIISFKNLLENLPNGPIMNFSTISRSLEKKKNKQNSQIFTDPKTCAALRLTRIFIIRSGTAPTLQAGQTSNTKQPSQGWNSRAPHCTRESRESCSGHLTLILSPAPRFGFSVCGPNERRSFPHSSVYALLLRARRRGRQTSLKKKMKIRWKERGACKRERVEEEEEENQWTGRKEKKSGGERGVGATRTVVKGRWINWSKTERLLNEGDEGGSQREFIKGDANKKERNQWAARTTMRKKEGYERREEKHGEGRKRRLATKG